MLSNRKPRTLVIKSQRSTMSDREYSQHCLSEAAAYGRAATWWFADYTRDGDADSLKQVVRHARLAARWALKVSPQEKGPKQ